MRSLRHGGNCVAGGSLVGRAPLFLFAGKTS
jgi:hypothetical protein